MSIRRTVLKADFSVKSRYILVRDKQKQQMIATSIISIIMEKVRPLCPRSSNTFSGKALFLSEHIHLFLWKSKHYWPHGIWPLSQMQQSVLARNTCDYIYRIPPAACSDAILSCDVIRTHFTLLNHSHVWRRFTAPSSPRDRFEWLCVIISRAAGHEYIMKHLKRVGDCNSSRPFKDAHCLAYTNQVERMRLKTALQAGVWENC